MPKLVRITTAPLSMKYLLAGQMKYMQEQGLEVMMISSEGKEWPDIIKNEKCGHHIISMTRKITPVADLISLWKLYRFFKNYKPDIVHSHTPKAGLIAMLAAKFAGIKIRIHTIAGLRFMTATGITRKILVQMEKLTARAATHIWPNSFSLLTYIRSNKLVSEKKLELIGLGSSNGINLSRFNNEALDAERLKTIKQWIKFKNEFIYLLCVGRIVKDKGIEELVYAFEKLYAADNNLRLLLVGVFEDELDPVNSETKEKVHSHPGIILTGWSDDVEYYMSFSFALIHPSYREGFPNVLLQAGAMGCPVICSRIEGNVDIIEDQVTGLIFTAKNKEDLLQKMEYGLRNPTLLRKYSDNLKLKVQANFSQVAVHDFLYKKYMELLNPGKLAGRSEKYESAAGTYT